MTDYLGNRELLKKHKVGFLASRKISTLAVLPTLDWASEIAKREDVVVVSGFHSPLERDVLNFLLRGSCGIIVVLARGMYKEVPELFSDAFETHRVLFISNEPDTVLRVSQRGASRRNEYIASIVDSIVFPAMHPQSSLFIIYNNIRIHKPTKCIWSQSLVDSKNE